MGILGEIIFLLAGVILGGLLGPIAQAGFESLTKPKTRELFRDWKSMWQPALGAAKDWVQEDLVISRHWGKLKFKNSNSSASYEWKGLARFASKGFLLGEWWSSKAGATAHGTFCLVIDPEDDYMSGFFLSSDNKDTMFMGGFIVAKGETILENARKRLQQVGTALLN